ncbi:ferritin heavy chain-like [Molossus nigricans]|uniref:ferritin heavy chain-like n=1 Tax=Molossus molossus TaxID=27622 RepID=UPI001746A77D|nr:ferritin heavy chain-like [Molossus molossus]
MTTPPLPQLCQSYHPDCEAALNHQISLELYASYVFRSMATYFESTHVALKHVSQFFLTQSNEQREHAQRLMWLQNQRGGRTLLHDISSPDRNHWDSSLKAMESAVCLAVGVNQNLVRVQQLAMEKNDAHLCSFLERNSLHEQVKSIQEVGEHLTNFLLLRAPEVGLAEHLRDKLTLDDKKK